MKVWNRHAVPPNVKPRYVGRGTPLGNPFPISETHDRAAVVKLYRKYAARKLSYLDKDFTEGLLDLAGTDDISCSCAPAECHGDVISEIWDYIRQDTKPLTAIRKWVRDNGYPQVVEKDGKDHINIYSKGATEVGRLWTNMSWIPFESPEFGLVQSMESLWHYVATGQKVPELLEMKPFEAKKAARELPKDKPSDFQDIIIRGLKDRMAHVPRLRALLGSTYLPFAHYYHYGSNDTILHTPHDWLIEAIENIRKDIKKECKKVVIAGSRRYKNYEFLKKVVEKVGFSIETVISGTEHSGVDRLGEHLADEKGWNIDSYPADWDKHGKAAGFIRNKEMGVEGDAGIVICVNQSPGSMNMIKILRDLDKPCIAVHINS